MANFTHVTAPTQFIEAGGIQFAYRRFGAGPGVPAFGSSMVGTSTFLFVTS